jgi:hypothetical protein
MRPHRTDKVSLIFGLLFLAVTGWWLITQTLDFGLPAIGWFVAGGLILFGLLGLFGALRSARTNPVSAAPTSATPVSVSPTSPPAVTSAPPSSVANGEDRATWNDR